MSTCAVLLDTPACATKSNHAGDMTPDCRSLLIALPLDKHPKKLYADLTFIGINDPHLFIAAHHVLRALKRRLGRRKLSYAF